MENTKTENENVYLVTIDRCRAAMERFLSVPDCKFKHEQARQVVRETERLVRYVRRLSRYYNGLERDASNIDMEMFGTQITEKERTLIIPYILPTKVHTNRMHVHDFFSAYIPYSLDVKPFEHSVVTIETVHECESAALRDHDNVEMQVVLNMLSERRYIRDDSPDSIDLTLRARRGTPECTKITITERESDEKGKNTNDEKTTF